VFSNDGKRVAYTAERGRKQVVVVDGAETTVKEGVLKNTPLFTPDGKHVLYGEHRGDHWALVLDGEPCFEFNSFVRGGRIVFDGPTSFHALVIRGGQFLRVEATIGSGKSQ
jgi:hypothetical protein